MHDPDDPLSTIALRHGTDKWGQHFYTPIYHNLFKDRRDRPVRLLEIGIGGYRHLHIGGESLCMWAEYFPQGTIVGIDLFNKSLDLGPRIHVAQGSQTSESFLRNLSDSLGPFNIVIDDGSHRVEDVIASFDILFPLLAADGIYVIEDTQTSYWSEYGGSLSPHARTTLNFVKTLVDDIDTVERQCADANVPTNNHASTIYSIERYHNLVIIRKGDNSEPSNISLSRSHPAVRRALESMQDRFDRNEMNDRSLANFHNLLTGLKEHEAASERLDAGLRRWPASQVLLWAAMRRAIRSGDATGALDIASRALSNSHSDPEFAMELFSTSSLSYDEDQLNRLTLDLVQRQADHFRAHHARARHLALAGHQEEALTHLRTAFELCPRQDGEALMTLARDTSRLGAHREAYDMAEAAIAARPERAEYYMHTGLILQHMGFLRLAEEHLQRTITMDSNHAMAQFHLSRLRLQRCGAAAALPAAMGACLLDPQNQRFQKHREMLQRRLAESR